jgi:hypothetical protein
MNRHSGSAAAFRPMWAWMPLAALGATVIAMAVFVALYGPAMRERGERLKAEQIDRENRALCEKLGMPHGTDRFGACADVLLEARRLHEERLATEAVGIL